MTLGGIHCIWIQVTQRHVFFHFFILLHIPTWCPIWAKWYNGQAWVQFPTYVHLQVVFYFILSTNSTSHSLTVWILTPSPSSHGLWPHSASTKLTIIGFICTTRRWYPGWNENRHQKLACRVQRRTVPVSHTQRRDVKSPGLSYKGRKSRAEKMCRSIYFWSVRYRSRESIRNRYQPQCSCGMGVSPALKHVFNMYGGNGKLPVVRWWAPSTTTESSGSLKGSRHRSYGCVPKGT